MKKKYMTPSTKFVMLNDCDLISTSDDGTVSFYDEYSDTEEENL